MYRRVINFLNRHNYFFQNQFGFRKYHSTSRAISLLINNIANLFNKNEKTFAVFLDLSKAFDTISTEMLLKNWTIMELEGKHITGSKSTYTIENNK